MKKKGILSALGVIALASLLVVGGTLAWFTDTETVTNTFNAGSIDVKINETWAGPISDWVPGDTEDKVVSVESLGESKTFVRVRLVPEWRSAEGEILGSGNLILDLGESSKWVYRHDDSAGAVSNDPFHGYFYYKEILDPGEVTDALLNSVTIDGPLTGNEYQRATLKLSVNVDAVQAENNAYQSVWGLTSLPFTTPSELVGGGGITANASGEYPVGSGIFSGEASLLDGKTISDVTSLTAVWKSGDTVLLRSGLKVAHFLANVNTTAVDFSTPYYNGYDDGDDPYWNDNVIDTTVRPTKVTFKVTFKNGETFSETKEFPVEQTPAV